MLDFVTIKAASSIKKNTTDIYPEFLVRKSKDLMIRGKSFYAVWDEEQGLWSRNEDDVQRMVDELTREFADHYQTDDRKTLKLLANFSSGKWTEWQKYCKSLPDNFHELDENITFSNSKVKKTDYVSRRLPYPLEQGECKAYEELATTLYDEEELEKLEWAIGSVIAGDSKTIQKFVVLYGGPGTGKSTMLNIIQELFEGYYSVFESKALASSNNAFALEAFRNNPLVAIQHDGDLSRIEDNTKLNSIVSHEMLVVNEKFKATYSSQFNSFLFMGTNKPVKITDAKSGIIRRLIDVVPNGNRRIPNKRFEELRNQIHFELGAIAYRCWNRYLSMGANYYDGYVPLSMMSSTNDFYNFVEDNYDFFTIDHPDGVTLNSAWLRYKEYCADANVSYPFSKRIFKDELKNYFEEFHERWKTERNYYMGFRREKLEYKPLVKPKKILEESEKPWLQFHCTDSLFDKEFEDCLAQYANDEEKPLKAWDKVETSLRKLNTQKLHYVRVPEHLIVIDFDLKDEKGEKSYEQNWEAAQKFPPTYAELSKGGGIHLHYYFDGDPTTLSRLYADDIEIKVFTGKSSLRRKLTKCNDLSIATINTGLPKKEGMKVIQDFTIKSERDLRRRIIKNLKKEYHPATKPSMDFIYKILEDAYDQGLKYDVRDMRPDIQQFALNSTHQSDYCLNLISKMKFCSEEPTENKENYGEQPIIFFDVEVFPNLFIVCYKIQGSDNEVVSMINPKPSDLEPLLKYRLVGFNNRDYDNHIVYARLMGYTEEQLFQLSQRIIVEKDRSAKFGEAYNLSYTDIYDFLSASNKMSLKKWEIKLGIHHLEFNWPWDKPVPKERWKDAADYCKNDVIATEAVWDANQGDWTARQILAILSGLSCNDTTNSHTTKIIVGNDPNPQSQFVYTDLSTIFPGYEYNPFGIDKERYDDPSQIVRGKSIYRGEDPGEGGEVYAEPGMYTNVALLDVASMHPHSAMVLNIFGDKYTKRFANLVEARVFIKHKDYDAAKKLLEEILDSLDKIGILEEYLSDPSKAKALADALKTAINSVYGLTSASFANKLKDPRNKDNIVAKYGALFMINLKHEVQKRGFTVVHIKTDSIKIADATPEIIQFVMEYGKEYGYTFEHEDTYSKMCIVNDAVYIAKYKEPHFDDDGKEIWWTATGTQFQVSYVFKTLFSKEAIEFKDLCEFKNVSTAMYLDMNETLDDPEQHNYIFIGKNGLFCPVKDGYGGGILLREGSDGKMGAVTGTKRPGKGEGSYRWLEAETVRLTNKQECIDKSYYNHLVDKAIEEISKYGDFEWFVSDDSKQKDAIDEALETWLDVPDGLPEEVPFEQYMNKPA